MTKPCVILLVACVAILHPLKARGADSSDSLYKAFETKLLYSETPDIGPAWRGGLRITDLIVWDGYLNVAGWFTMDLFMAGIPSLSLNDSSKTRSPTTSYSSLSNQDPFVCPYGATCTKSGAASNTIRPNSNSRTRTERSLRKIPSWLCLLSPRVFCWRKGTILIYSPAWRWKTATSTTAPGCLQPTVSYPATVFSSPTIGASAWNTPCSTREKAP